MPDFSRRGATALEERLPGPPQVDRPTFTDRLKSIFEFGSTISRTTVPNPSEAPWNAVALLNFFQGDAFVGFATGFLLRSDLVVSASHNLQLARPSSIGVYPGFDARNNPSNGIAARAWAWDGARDVAVIVTGQEVVNLFVPGVPGAASVRLAGYAYPYPDNGPQMTFGEGSCSSSGQQTRYRIGVRQGDSGAPVFNPGGGVEAAVAIHSRSTVSPAEGGLIGIGETIDADLQTTIKQLERQARAQIE